MQQIALSRFKAECLAILERVEKTGESVIVTRRGIPIAEIKPPTREMPDWIGSKRRSVTIVGDIVNEPAEPTEAWEAER